MVQSFTEKEFLEPKWFVLFLRSNQEKKTAQRLDVTGIEHYLPCCHSVRQWKDRRVNLEMPLFPGYIFVKLPLIERMKVLILPNVISFVSTGGFPSEISENEIGWLKRGTKEGQAEPHPYLTAGQRVVITNGAMSGMEGILVRDQKNARVVVALESIARAFVIEIDVSSVQFLKKPASNSTIPNVKIAV